MLLVCTIWILSIRVLVDAIQVDNAVQGSPEITCGDTFIGIRWRIKNSFEGYAFVREHYAESACRTGENENGKREVEIKVPFTSCGVQRKRSADPKGMFISTTVVISFHPRLVTKIDRVYFVQCFYMEAVKTVTAELEVSMLTTSLQTQTVPMPICHYEVLDGGPNGVPVKYARIGDQVYHKWTCDTDTVDTFCMIVHSCTVDDGEGRRVPLLDSNGCAQDKYLLGNLEYTSDLSVGKESHVFKYADRPSLYFNCQVSIGIREPGQPCPKPRCPEPQRGKRNSGIGQNETDLEVVWTSVTIKNGVSRTLIAEASTDQSPTKPPSPLGQFTTPTSQPEPNRNHRRLADMVCFSILGFSSYALLNVTMTVVSLSLFITVYKRSRT